MASNNHTLAALLGILAIAGYQHRDKLSEMLRGAGQPTGAGAPGAGGPAGMQTAGKTGGLGDLLRNMGGASAGGLLGGGLSELMERFRQAGQGDVAESWVGTGPNREVAPQQLEHAIGSDTLATLSRQTGLPQDEILRRLSRELPSAVDQYTPEGRLPLV